MKKEKKDSRIEDSDGLNRAFYGSPTAGGVIIMLGIAGYMIYDLFFKH
ncbi:hypothetical protein LRR81_09090 [Metabacillus sp. GX 13764]|nr:hypothetical protein [Metabacillus kandeliae]MCD7034390.1 hypothetical protein [Metabacillus kandeliae]